MAVSAQLMAAVLRGVHSCREASKMAAQLVAAVLRGVPSCREASKMAASAQLVAAVLRGVPSCREASQMAAVRGGKMLFLNRLQLLVLRLLVFVVD